MIEISEDDLISMVRKAGGGLSLTMSSPQRISDAMFSGVALKRFASLIMDLAAFHHVQASHKQLVEELELVRGQRNASNRRIEELTGKLAELEGQEPFDASDERFREAFEATIKHGNWPDARKGDWYRSPMTQMAWDISFATVNRLKLYDRTTTVEPKQLTDEQIDIIKAGHNTKFYAGEVKDHREFARAVEAAALGIQVSSKGDEE